ncbi:MAG: S53 family peptidase [Micromonosporaceae bacterium]|nr:S53 family peptidase [Micromonosporaceae bacterium]
MAHKRRAHKRRTVRLGLVVAALAASTAASGTAAADPAVPAPSSPPARSSAATVADPQRVCGLPVSGRMACLALLLGALSAQPATGHAGAQPGVTAPFTTHPFTAADLQSAYQLPSALLGARQTIAIVDAYDDPNAAKDVAVYRATNQLPACDADFPCFRKVDQRGGIQYPPTDSGWAVEISLDLDMASAACPNCQLLLVEADDNTVENLAAAVDEAVALGADVISNSYGTLEYSSEVGSLGPHFDHPGVALVASSGDSGFGVAVPAALPGVVAVGGTTLFPDGSARGWGETGWSGAGSGCSAYVAKPRWQHDQLCGMRSVADVAAVADPRTPVAVYDTFGQPGWVAVGGTSVAAPLVAGVYALAGNAGTIEPAQYLGAHPQRLNDVVAGANGDCGGGYLCHAGNGYDGPTGWGTPDGIGAF